MTEHLSGLCIELDNHCSFQKRQHGNQGSGYIDYFCRFQDRAFLLSALDQIDNRHRHCVKVVQGHYINRIAWVRKALTAPGDKHDHTGQDDIYKAPQARHRFHSSAISLAFLLIWRSRKKRIVRSSRLHFFLFL